MPGRAGCTDLPLVGHADDACIGQASDHAAVVIEFNVLREAPPGKVDGYPMGAGPRCLAVCSGSWTMNYADTTQRVTTCSFEISPFCAFSCASARAICTFWVMDLEAPGAFQLDHEALAEIVLLGEVMAAASRVHVLLPPDELDAIFAAAVPVAC
jgi:hypothetical protein